MPAEQAGLQLLFLSMKYEKIKEAKFIERINRFVAIVELPGGEVTKVHVKNTGRCKELLLPGAKVYLEDFEGRMGTRRMQYSLVAVEKVVNQGAGQGTSRESILLNMDSQAPNKVVQEALSNGRICLPGMSSASDAANLMIKPESKYGDSRFDFYVEACDKGAGAKEAADTEAVDKRGFIEVKGVTLEEDGHARFPDAPTERGVKHINELISAHEEGYEAYILFVVQMEGAKDVAPNDVTHPQFGEALVKAAKAGVNILAYDCLVTPDSLIINNPIPFRFQ